MLAGLEQGVLLGQLIDPPAPTGRSRSMNEIPLSERLLQGQPGLQLAGAGRNLEELRPAGRPPGEGRTVSGARTGGDFMASAYEALAPPGSNEMPTKLRRGLGPTGARADVGLPEVYRGAEGRRA